MSAVNLNDEAELELAQFRSQWQQEVTQRAHQQHSTQSSSAGAPASAAPVAGSSKRRPSAFGQARPAHVGHSRTKSHVSHGEHDEDEATPLVTDHAFDDSHVEFPQPGAASENVPKSALEHFEKAIEREGQGNLGDSLNLYRKAYRMDPKIDTKYREKYYPRVPTTVNTAHHSSSHTSHSGGSGAAPAAPVASSTEPLPIASLISSFSSLCIQANPLPTIASRKSEKAPESREATTEPEPERGFSLLARLPHELLLHVLSEVAYLDIASFARCALVCKSLAFIVATEESIWKGACLDSRWGFPGQVWNWKCGVLGEGLPSPDDEIDEEFTDTESDSINDGNKRPDSPPSVKELLPKYKNSYKTMFSTRPRVRFNGLYISTCNYIRPGAFHSASALLTGAAPVHIVTYYRYIRFYQDGTCLSLLSTHEPPEVVYYLSKPTPSQPQGYSSVLHPWGKHVLRGRWRLDPLDTGDVDVETESASGEKYLFKMGFTIKSAGAGGKGRGQKLNKLLWRGYWSWNRLTDDVGEFSLKNDKPFFWSRVKKFDREILGEDTVV